MSDMMSITFLLEFISAYISKVDWYSKGRNSQSCIFHNQKIMALDWTANADCWKPLALAKCFNIRSFPIAEDCSHVFNYRWLHLKKNVDILFIKPQSLKCWHTKMSNHCLKFVCQICSQHPFCHCVVVIENSGGVTPLCGGFSWQISSPLTFWNEDIFFVHAFSLPMP